MKKKAKPRSDGDIADHAVELATERWAPVQVASHLRMSYQDARNAMLEGRFGESEYDAKTRKLTVLAWIVRAEKEKRTRSRVRKRSTKKSRTARKRR